MKETGFVRMDYLQLAFPTCRNVCWHLPLSARAVHISSRGGPSQVGVRNLHAHIETILMNTGSTSTHRMDHMHAGVNDSHKRAVIAAAASYFTSTCTNIELDRLRKWLTRWLLVSVVTVNSTYYFVLSVVICEIQVPCSPPSRKNTPS